MYAYKSYNYIHVYVHIHIYTYIDIYVTPPGTLCQVLGALVHGVEAESAARLASAKPGAARTT